MEKRKKQSGNSTDCVLDKSRKSVVVVNSPSDTTVYTRVIDTSKESDSFESSDSSFNNENTLARFSLSKSREFDDMRQKDSSKTLLATFSEDRGEQRKSHPQERNQEGVNK